MYEAAQYLGGAKDERWFTVGDLYSMSERELEKAYLGVNLPCIAFKGLTDLYVKGGEFKLAAFSSPKCLRMRAAIFVHSTLGLHNVLMCCILKEEPAPEERRSLVENGAQGWSG
jgi:hypothetical protein